MTTIRAHFDGKHSLVLDEPVNLPVGTPLCVHIETAASQPTFPTERPPLPIAAGPEVLREALANSQGPWRPLDIQIDPELSNAIALDPEFNVEES